MPKIIIPLFTLYNVVRRAHFDKRPLLQGENAPFELLRFLKVYLIYI